MKKKTPDHDMEYKIIDHGPIEGTDLESENVVYRFTKAQKEALREEIKPVIKAGMQNLLREHDMINTAHDLDKQQARRILEDSAEPLFLANIENACNFMMWMKQAPSRQDHRDKLADMLKSFKQTARYLRQIYEIDVYIPFKRKITRPLFPTINPVASILAKESVVAARKTEQHLERIIKIIEKYQRLKIAKGSPGSYTTQLAASVAHAYYFNFRVKPTTYFDGPFVKIFNKLLDILGLDYKDNSRAIRAAIKSVEEEFNLE